MAVHNPGQLYKPTPHDAKHYPVVLISFLSHLAQVEYYTALAKR